MLIIILFSSEQINARRYSLKCIKPYDQAIFTKKNKNWTAHSLNSFVCHSVLRIFCNSRQNEITPNYTLIGAQVFRYGTKAKTVGHMIYLLYFGYLSVKPNEIFAMTYWYSKYIVVYFENMRNNRHWQPPLFAELSMCRFIIYNMQNAYCSKLGRW